LDSFTDSDLSMQVITAEPIPGTTTEHFRELAEEHNMIIVFGMCESVDDTLYERVESGTYVGEYVQKIYNSAAIVFPDAETLSYRKTQRAGASSATGEGQWSVTGDGPVMFDTKWGKVGIDICRDGHFYPEEGRYIAASGCNIFLHITATTGGPWYRETRIGSYTDRDGMAAITANLLGLDGMPQVRDIIFEDDDVTPVLSGTGNLTYTPWRPATAEDDFPFTNLYDIAAYQEYLSTHPANTSAVDSARLYQFSYGPFNSTSLIIDFYHDAEGRKSFDTETGYAIDLNGTGPESEGFAERGTSPYGLEVAELDLSGTGFNIMNFNPDLFSRMYDDLAVSYREGYESIYPGESFSDGTDGVYDSTNNTNADPDDDTTYPVTAHFGTWNGSGTATATIDADHLKFAGLLKDGVAVDASAYTITPGSTVITLSEAYLKGLAVGDHSFTALFTDGASEALTLRVAGSGGQEDDAADESEQSDASTVPGTGDTALPFVGTTAALLAITATMLALRRRHKARLSLAISDEHRTP
jgi:hypothetical protein